MEYFLNLSTKFIEIASNIDVLDCIDEYQQVKINTLLNELVGLDYKFLQITDFSDCFRLLNSLKNIPIAEDTLIVKSCCLIVQMFEKAPPVQIPSGTLRSLVQWLIKALTYNLDVDVGDILRAISLLFKGNVESIPEIKTDLLKEGGILLTLLVNPRTINIKSLKYETCTMAEIQLATMTCMETLLSTNVSLSEDNAEAILSATINVIYKCDQGSFGSFSYHTLITSALSICQKMCFIHQHLAEKYTGELLGACKAFMNVGLSDCVFVMPQKISISQQALGELPQVAVPVIKGGKVAKVKKLRISKEKKADPKTRRMLKTEDGLENINQIETQIYSEDGYQFYTLTATSHSDFSESECGRAKGERQKLTNLRLSALNLIGTLGKVLETKQLFGYWHSIFPAENSQTTSSVLLISILKDPNHKCRMAALQAISLFLVDSKVFLIHAESTNKMSTSFVPFSVSLGNMIVSMYTMLTQALSTESSLLVVTQILKCLTVLIQVTPFKRLQQGFVGKLVYYIRKLCFHKDTSIQLAALKAIEFLISTNDITNEIFECVGLPNQAINTHKNPNQLIDSGINEHVETEFDEEYDSDSGDTLEGQKLGCKDFSHSSNEQMSWLLRISLVNIGVENMHSKEFIPQTLQTPITQTNIRVQCLLILTTMASHYIWVKNYLNFMINSIRISFMDPLPEIRLYAAKMLDVFGYAMNIYLLSEGSPKQEDLTECIHFWIHIIPLVVYNIQDPKINSPLKGVCCDALSNIGVHVYERLSRDKQISLISLLSGCSCDTEPSIRGAAVRALAIYALFPSLKEDRCFIENSSESIIHALKETNLEVRIKSSWALGNISDALLANNSDFREQCVSDDLLYRLLEISIKCKSNDKIKSNIVRAIGNLLRLVDVNKLHDPIWQQICYQVIMELYQSSSITGNVKVKWNACYAIGNFMKNHNLFNEYKGFNWQDIIFPGLAKIITNNPNFKVRTNAAVALAVPEKRKFIDKYFSTIWQSLLKALDQTNNMADFSEYQHRDNLVEQLCITVSHYIILSDFDDLVIMENALEEFDTIKGNWTRVINRVLPERAASLLAASLKLKNMNSEIMKVDGRKALLKLQDCFIPLTEYT